MQLFLQASGYHVTTAHNVEAALQRAAQEEFDLLVSDIGLPDGTGEDLIRQRKGTLIRHHSAGTECSRYRMQRARRVPGPSYKAGVAQQLRRQSIAYKTARKADAKFE